MKSKQVKFSGGKYIRSAGGIEEYRLKINDLRILLFEDHTMPVAVCMVTYHVGSRNEATGYTGATHILEHLMFKGSKKYNRKNGNGIWDLEARGARVNATTWFDRTNYFEIIPSEHLEDAIRIEADRMRNARIEEKDRLSEMPVVRNEFERGENDPFEILDKNIWATAFQSHPYHHPTIGWRSDIENVSIDRLKQFYDTFYWPNNATVTIIGSFDKKQVLQQIQKYFGKYGKAPHTIPLVYTTESKQEGQKRVTVRRAGSVSLIGIAYKIPEGLHKDTHALMLLSSILGDGKSSRLYKALVDSGMATEILQWSMPLHDPSLFISYAFLTPQTKLEKVERKILHEYDRIIKNGIKKEELEKAKAKICSETAFARDGAYALASSLNEAIALGDWTFFTNFQNKVKAVTVKDVERVALTYLVHDQSTIGIFESKKTSNEAA